MMGEKLVSILVPLYNGERYIKHALTSILNQTYKNLEVVISDNDSTDNSVAVVNSFKDPRIRLIRNPANTGAEENWNKTLKEACGAYIKMMGCDDLLHPACIEKQVAILDDTQHRDIGLVSCSRHIINSSSRIIMTRAFGRKSGRVNGRTAIKEIIRSGTNPVGEPLAGLFRASMRDEIGYYRTTSHNPHKAECIAIKHEGFHVWRYAPDTTRADTMQKLMPKRVEKTFQGSYAIDVDYWVRILARKDLYVIKEPLCSFRISPNSWSSQIGRRQLKEFIQFIKLTAKENPGYVTGVDALIGQIRCCINVMLRVMVFRLYA
ncbi:MAG: glycosyltransferase family 2 protein [Deltaproteobacteria bacterium]|nr:glycosyltransferase family 2 protein [Deltaproteobacteria bacterium]